MVMVRLVFQPPLCGIGLEMRRLLDNNYLLISYRVFTDILFGVLLYSAFEWLLLVRALY